MNHISPLWEPFVPNMATLFTHNSTNVNEEIMFKSFGGSGDDFAVEMLFLKYLVYVRPVTMHLFSKPFDCSSLLVENRFDNMSYMKIRHPCTKIS